MSVQAKSSRESLTSGVLKGIQVSRGVRQVHTAANAHKTAAEGWFAGGPAFPADGFGLLARDVVPWRSK